jgi:hypothetical protein
LSSSLSQLSQLLLLLLLLRSAAVNVSKTGGVRTPQQLPQSSPEKNRSVFAAFSKFSRLFCFVYICLHFSRHFY